MKTLLLTIILLMGFNLYAQENQFEKQKLKNQLKAKLKDEYSDAKLNVLTLDELKEKIKEVEKEINGKYIDSTKTVVYDFKRKVYTVSNVIPKVGEPLVLKIEKINRLAYDVTIKSSDVAIVDEYFNDEIKTAIRATNEFPEKLIPVEEKSISIPILKEKSTNSPDIKIVKENKITKFNDSIFQQNKLKLEAKAKIATSENKIILMKNTILNDAIILVADSSRTDIADTIKENKIKILNATNEIMIKNIEIDKIELEIKRLNDKINKLQTHAEVISKTFYHLRENYTSILNQYLVIKNIETEYQDFRQLALNPLLNYQTYKEERAKPDFILNKMQNYDIELSKFNNLINSFNDAFYSAMYGYDLSSYTSDEYQMEYVRSKYQQIKDEVEKIKSNFETLDVVAKLLKVYSIDSVLSNVKAYEILSAPIQPFEDYVTFDVEIKHRDAKRLAEYDDNRKFTYMEYTQGGVRFDFSVGAVFNFGGNNNKYEIKDVTIETITGESPNQITTLTNKKRIVLTENNNFIPMLAGMFHTSFRRNGNFAFGLTLGASINVETFELNSLFPGVSLLIGKKQKLILTAGPAFRQVNVLKNNYIEGENYDIGEFSDSSQLTAKQFRIGGFFGITYNLTQKQRGKFKINGAE